VGKLAPLQSLTTGRDRARGKRQCAHDHDDRDEQNVKSGPSVERSRDPEARLLADHGPRDCEHGTIIRKRPASIASPITTFHQGVFAFSPANADPLFPVALENA